MTSKQIIHETGLSQSTVTACIRRARAHGTKFLRIAGYVGNLPLYGPGPGDDAEDTRTLARVLDYLDSQVRGTNAEIAEATGLPFSTVDSITRRLHAAERVHIAGWKIRIGRSGGGKPAARFAMGRGKGRGPGVHDAPRPDAQALQRAAEARRAEKRRMLGKMENGVVPRGPNKNRRPPAPRVGVFASMFNISEGVQL